MASARCGLVGLGNRDRTIAAGHAVLGAQVVVQIGKDRTGNMRLLVLLASGAGLAQIEAAVEHHAGPAAGLQRKQLFRGNQGGVGDRGHRRIPRQ
ncbi:hypothetical protein D3C71_2012000 [compost metagenome]